MAERAVKSLVMGRKNWLFSQRFASAQTSGIILSLIETAKRHGLDPEKYLNYLLQKLPNEESLNSEAQKLICHGKKRFKRCVNREYEKKAVLENQTRTFFQYTLLFDAYIHNTTYILSFHLYLKNSINLPRD